MAEFIRNSQNLLNAQNTNDLQVILSLISVCTAMQKCLKVWLKQFFAKKWKLQHALLTLSDFDAAYVCVCVCVCVRACVCLLGHFTLCDAMTSYSAPLPTSFRPSLNYSVYHTLWRPGLTEFDKDFMV